MTAGPAAGSDAWNPQSPAPVPLLSSGRPSLAQKGDKTASPTLGAPDSG